MTEALQTMAERSFFITRLHRVYNRWHCQMSSANWWTASIGSGETWQEAVEEALEKVTVRASGPSPFHDVAERKQKEADEFLENLFKED